MNRINEEVDKLDCYILISVEVFSLLSLESDRLFAGRHT